MPRKASADKEFQNDAVAKGNVSNPKDKSQPRTLIIEREYFQTE